MDDPQSNAPRRFVVVGGSSAAGFGVAGRSYADLLRAGPPAADVRNLAHTANQISDSAKLLPAILAIEPQVVIVAHGISEAILRPADRAMRWVLPRWRTKGWLDPRPYFSRRRHRAIFQRTESAVRWRYKNWLIRRFGATRWTDEHTYAVQLRAFIDSVLQQPDAHVMLLTHPGISERFFPGSPASLERYRHVTLGVAAEYAAHPPHVPRVAVCDISGLMRAPVDYFADAFHPNVSGHARIAAALGAALDQVGWRGPFRATPD